MEIFVLLKKYIFLIFIIILPFLCFITRKISPSLNSLPSFEFIDNSFFGITEVKIKNNPLEEWIYKFKDYNKTRLSIETKFDKIRFYYTFSNHKYYYNNQISFFIILKLNESLLTLENNSIIYTANFKKYINVIKIKKITDNIIDDIKDLFPEKKVISLNKIIINYNKNNSNIKCELYFDDFNLNINLEKERLTFNFFYLLQNYITSIIHTCIIGTFFWENNLQNINILFLYIVSAKMISENSKFLNLYEVGFPILKFMIFYFHLLNHGEFILSYIDLISTFLIIWSILFILIAVYLILVINTNYCHCFNNKILNSEIVIKDEFIITQHDKTIFVYFLVVFDIIFNSIYIKAIPLIISLILTIFKHLNQREVMCKKDKIFCIKIYTAGILIYSFHLLIYNFGDYYMVKPTYCFLPFLLISIFSLILIIIIKYEYKFVYAMKKDFEILKIIDKEYCSICLKYFNYDKNKNNKLFCRVTQDENIHKTSCYHYFHEICLFNWRKYKNICPICRKPLDTPNYYYFYDETPCIYKPNYYEFIY